MSSNFLESRFLEIIWSKVVLSVLKVADFDTSTSSIAITGRAILYRI